jgi:hypothetical protein
MPQFTVGTHNMLFKLDAKRWDADLQESDKAEVVGYQEAADAPQRNALTRHAAATNRAVSAGHLPISWDIDTFRHVTLGGLIFAGEQKVHKSAIGMGIDAKFNPPRYFGWVGLRHIETREKFLFVNVHPVAGGTKPESHPTHKDGERLSIYKDWGVAQYWFDVVSFVAGEMSRDRGKADRFSPFWDGIVLLGDFNATMDNKEEWYYPANLLDPFFHADPQRKGIDHIMRTRGSDLKPVKRWQEPANTDHDLEFQTYRLKEITDFPRDI